ncbi:MAG: hypothetical protein KatS3mg031_0090 [Chitinophagales bacterium]|nr:MAG: hypothetical protein KatS3mg031_0090 [Chitinophagales bacterium]
MKGFWFAVGLIFFLSVAILIAGFFLPAETHTEKSLVMKAPADIIFQQIDSLKNWRGWAFWLSADPQTGFILDTPQAGTGSHLIWKNKTGTGVISITESQPFKSITFEVLFDSAGTGTGYFKLEPIGENTRVTHGFISHWNFTQRVAGPLFNQVTGKILEGNLSRLSRLSYHQYAMALGIAFIDSEKKWAAVIRDTISRDELYPRLQMIFQNIRLRLQQADIPVQDTPLAIFHKTDSVLNYADVEAGLFLTDSVSLPEGLRLIKVGGKALKGVHTGSYRNMPSTYKRLFENLHISRVRISGPPREVYLLAPPAEPDSTRWVTEIYIPI